MKILVYGINYYPESIGIAKYSTEMCEWLANQGHTVEVITAMPSYPHWSIMAAYRGRAWHTEVIGNVKIRRCPLYVPARVTGLSRILCEITFVLSSSFYWIACLFKSYSVVICVAPPLQLGLAGVVYRIFHRSMFIFHIQDLQLDAAKQLGLVKNKMVLGLMVRLEKWVLKKADYVTTISQGMKRVISLKGIDPNKIIDLKNWIDTNAMVPQTPDVRTRAFFGIEPEQKIVMYSGNIGEKQGMDLLLLAAESLRDTDIVFLVIGDGAYKNKFSTIVQEKALINVRIFPLQPYEKLCEVLNVADLHLVLQKKAAADLVMPSKLTAILSVGGVAIVTAEPGTTLHDIISEHKMGILIEPENPEKLKRAIVENIRNDLREYKRNARHYAEANLEKSIVLHGFQDFLIRKGL